MKIDYDSMAYVARVKNGKVEYLKEYSNNMVIVYTEKITEHEYNNRAISSIWKAKGIKDYETTNNQSDVY